MWLGDVQGFDSARDATCVTPLGGATVFVVFLQKLGLVEKIRQHMPSRWFSNRALISRGTEGSAAPGFIPLLSQIPENKTRNFESGFRTLARILRHGRPTRINTLRRS